MKNKLIIVLFSLFCFCACENVVDVDIQSFEEALIVEGGISHDISGSSNLQTIRLSKTVDFLAQEGAQPVTDAQVRVFDGTQDYAFTHVGEGSYSANIPTVVGRTYQLTINYENQEIIAEEQLASVTPIDSIYSVFEEATSFTDEGYFVKIDTRDEAGTPNFYHWRLFINDTLTIIPDPGNQANLIASDEFFDGQAIIGYKPNEEIILSVGDQVRVEQLGITERYYDYLFQIFGQTSGVPLLGNPPPARIRGNLLNTTEEDRFVLGYFSAVAKASAETIVVE